MEIQNSTFSTLQEVAFNQDGLVLHGAGGDLQEWIDGVTQMLKDEGVASSEFKVTEAHKVTTSGGRTDLLLLFDWSTVTVGTLAIWRIKFGDCSWLSDYINNYRDQHLFQPIEN
jgi:hypothetical protein